MHNFLALYLAPASVLDEWAKTDPETQKVEEAKMKQEWDAWLKTCAGNIKETAGTGKPKRISSQGTEDARNDVMLYSMVEAESLEAAAKLFEGHPHLQIPQATIEVMPVRILPGM